MNFENKTMYYDMTFKNLLSMYYFRDKRCVIS